MQGRLTVITGPMFSGKTTRLVKVASLFGPSCLVVKPVIDDRYGRFILMSHDGIETYARVVYPESVDFSLLLNWSTTIVCIDELNFFSFEQIYPQIEWLCSHGIDVIASGLSYDFKKQPFGATLPLSSHAERVVHLFAVCDRCGSDAAHSYRKVAQEDQVLVGASESYGACCDTCWEVLTS